MTHFARELAQTITYDCNTTDPRTNEPEQALIAIYLFYGILVLTTTINTVLALCKKTKSQYYAMLLRQTLYGEGFLCILISQITEACFPLWVYIVTLFFMVWVICTMRLRQYLLAKQSAEMSNVPRKVFGRSWTVTLSNWHVYTGPLICMFVIILTLGKKSRIGAEFHLTSIFIYVLLGIGAVFVGICIDSRPVKLKTPSEKEKEKEKKKKKSKKSKKPKGPVEQASDPKEGNSNKLLPKNTTSNKEEKDRPQTTETKDPLLGKKEEENVNIV